MKSFLLAGAALALLLASLPRGAEAQSVNMGATVASDGACPSNTPLVPGPGRYVYQTSNGALCISGSITASNPSVGTNSSTAPSSSTQVGFTNGSGNLVSVSPTNPLPITSSPTTGTTTNASATITTGGTFQSILAASGTRKGCFVQNPITATETLFVFLGATGSATTLSSVNVAPGGAFSCNNNGVVATDNVAATATTSGHAYVEMSQ